MIIDYSDPVHDPEFSADPHIVTYSGSPRLGFTWRCSCGATNGGYPWEDCYDRNQEAHEHLRLYLACMGCCYDLNRERLNRQEGNR